MTFRHAGGRRLEATEDAAAFQATIDALATNQAEVVAIATENAENGANALATANAQATEVAEIAAVATENAESGANDLATAEAAAADAQATIDALEADQESADEDLATAQARVNVVQTTVASLEEEQAAAEATATVLAEAAANSALDPNQIDLTIDVSLGGILGGDGDARADAMAQLDDVLAPYVDCRVGFVLIGGFADNIGQGNDFAEADLLHPPG